MLLLALLPVTAPADLTIGVLAFRGEAAAMARWASTADYLSATVPGETFRIQPLDLDGMSEAVESGAVDFVLTNTGHYVVLEARHGVSRLATLKVHHGEQQLTRFGAVIFTRSDNQDIQGIRDLAGRSFMAVSRDAFGGFQMAWREMLDQGIDPFSDLGSLVFRGFPQDAIVRAVLAGEVDAGTVRAGTLDRMIAEGRIDASTVRIVDPRTSERFPYTHSTRLYPEWPLAKTRQTPETLAQQVAIALLGMPTDSVAAQDAGASWTIPLDYGSVHALFRRLEIGPYAELSRPAPWRVWREYRGWILTGIGTVLLLGMMVFITGRANRRISLSQARLRQEVDQRKRTEELLAAHRDNLERRVAERTEALAAANESLRRSEATLRRLHEITSSARATLETQVEQLLEEGCRYFRLARGCLVAAGDGDDISPLQSVCSRGDDSLEISRRLVRLALSRLADGENVVAVADPGASPADPMGGALLATRVSRGDSAPACLVFSDPDARDVPFSDVDRDILLLMAGWLANARDKQEISRRSEEHRQQLAHVTRLGTMGEMVAGIAHELNQPLTAIVNYANGCARMIRRNPGATGEIGDAVDRIAGDALRAAETIRRMRAFLRPGKIHSESLSPSSCIDVALDIVGARLRQDGIEVQRDESTEPLQVEADRVQVEQVIINLLLNAMDALQHIPRDRRRLSVSSKRQGESIRIAVTDNGPGFTREARNRLFHPFFSTKSGGMGMGLSISRTIAEAHGGEMTVDRTPSGLTRVSLLLPARQPLAQSRIRGVA